MDFLRTIYSFDPTISIIMLVGMVIGVWGAIVEKNKRIFWCLLMAEGMYAVLVYLGMKLGYMGIMIFFGLIILLAVLILLIQTIKERKIADSSCHDIVIRNVSIEETS